MLHLAVARFKVVFVCLNHSFRPMRAIIQRVSSASVIGIYEPYYLRWHHLTGSFPPQVAGEKISEIGQGLMVLIGIGAGARSSSGHTRTRPD